MLKQVRPLFNPCDFPQPATAGGAVAQKRLFELPGSTPQKAQDDGIAISSISAAFGAATAASAAASRAGSSVSSQVSGASEVGTFGLSDISLPPSGHPSPRQVRKMQNSQVDVPP